MKKVALLVLLGMAAPTVGFAAGQEAPAQEEEQNDEGMSTTAKIGIAVGAAVVAAGAVYGGYRWSRKGESDTQAFSGNNLENQAQTGNSDGQL